MSFLKLIIQKIGNTKSGSLKNETENNYYKVITKCDRSLLQSASGITKCDRLLLQNASSKVINNLFDYSCLKIYVRKNIKTNTSNEIRKCGHNLQAFWDMCQERQ